nr:hypothetical protein [Bacteroides xylanisolvens]
MLSAFISSPWLKRLYQLLVVLDSTVVWFLDGTPDRSIIACNSQNESWNRPAGDRTLHQSFAERTASYDIPLPNPATAR